MLDEPLALNGLCQRLLGIYLLAPIIFTRFLGDRQI